MNAKGGVIHLILNSESLNSAKARQNNMAANHYKPDELFSQFYLQNIEKDSFSEENTDHAIAF